MWETSSGDQSQRAECSWRRVALSLAQPAVYRPGQPCQTTLIPTWALTSARTHTNAIPHTQLQWDLRARVNPPTIPSSRTHPTTHQLLHKKMTSQNSQGLAVWSVGDPLVYPCLCALAYSITVRATCSSQWPERENLESEGILMVGPVPWLIMGHVRMFRVRLKASFYVKLIPLGWIGSN